MSQLDRCLGIEFVFNVTNYYFLGTKHKILKILDIIEITFPMKLWPLFTIIDNDIVLHYNDYGLLNKYAVDPRTYQRRNDGFSPRTLLCLHRRFKRTCSDDAVEMRIGNERVIFDKPISELIQKNQLPSWLSQPGCSLTIPEVLALQKWDNTWFSFLKPDIEMECYRKFCLYFTSKHNMIPSKYNMISSNDKRNYFMECVQLLITDSEFRGYDLSGFDLRDNPFTYIYSILWHHHWDSILKRETCTTLNDILFNDLNSLISEYVVAG